VKIRRFSLKLYENFRRESSSKMDEKWGRGVAQYAATIGF
jgi:hypothetical protein